MNTCQTHVLNNGGSCAKKIKTFKTRCETQYDKPKEHILNIVIQSSDNKILVIKIVLNKGKCKILPSCTYPQREDKEGREKGEIRGKGREMRGELGKVEG